MSGLLALCGLALLVQHVAERGSNFHGSHLAAGALMLTVAVIVWFLPSEPQGVSAGARDRGEYRQAARVIRSKRLDCLRLSFLRQPSRSIQLGESLFCERI